MSEYPNTLYKGTVDAPDTVIVADEKEQAAAVKKGWKTSDEFYKEWRNRHSKPKEF